MAESRVIFLIVGAIIAGSLLLLSTNVLHMVKSQVGNIEKIGKTETSKFNPGGLYQACDYWLSIGSERYSSDVILNQVELPKYMSPYRDLWMCCGSTLDKVAKTCYKGTGRDCSYDGYEKADAVSGCVQACENVLVLYDLCNTQCPDSRYTCMDYLIDYVGKEMCRNRASVPANVLERACGER